MYTIDANVFARDTDPTEPEYLVCHTLLEALDQRQLPIIVPNLMLAELAASISRTRRDPMRARIIADALAHFTHIQLVPLDDLLAQMATELAADRALRGADAVYVAVAQQYNCVLITLDREQRERATAVVRALTPAQALAELEQGST